MPCSVGTYKHGNECIRCPKGRYKDTDGDQACTTCDEGTFNDHEGSTNKSACLECPEGYYNKKAGQAFCLSCTRGELCPAGTTTPKDVADDVTDEKNPRYELLDKSLSEYLTKNDNWWWENLFAWGNLIILVFAGLFTLIVGFYRK